MPRLLAAEYVYSGAMDDCYNDYVTAAATTQTPLIPPIIQQQQHIASLQEQHTHLNLTNTMPADTLTNSQNPTGNLSTAAANSNNTQQQSKLEEQQIHSISSSDEDLVIEQNTIEEEITNISSDECGDFEGFDDYTTPNSSGFINDASQEDLNNSCNYLKRHSHIDFNEYREDSEGVVEAIEVEDDDDDEEIAIGDDGQIIYRTRDETTPKKLQTYRCEPHTPNKRKKQEQENYFNAISPALLKTPPDQIVEINSDSTTNSLKQKRQQINTKLQLNLSQQQNHRAQNNPNKCSTESTSEFPVSSPSNPQQPRGGKYPPRPPLLKNTLPADSFERQLAMITACNPQMTLAEKIQSWICNEDLSDVEDVNRFDEEFKRLEKQKKLEMKQREKSGCLKNAKNKSYDFCTFRQMILRNMNEQKNRKFNPNSQAAGFSGVTGGKCLESSGSESSKSAIHVDDRPTTSAVAQQQLQQRRSKPQLNLETGEPKKRLVKEISKRNQNSTTPPQTSSSDNERECFQKTTKAAAIHTHNKNITRQNHQQQKQNKLFCPSSSEEAISQDIPTHVLLKTNNKFSSLNKNSTTNSVLQPPAIVTNTNETKNPRILTDEEIDSVFRLHRLNRERDKYNDSPPNETAEQQPTSIIQMRLDFADENKSELLMEKKQELFKTPIIPQKYLANPCVDNLRQHNLSPFKPATNEELNTENPSAAAINSSKTEIKNEITNEKLTSEISATDNNDDFDGVYHQQHEFCNYLGLTGMSTATAMANAVAELAQCNLARRSMRVLRQQQQERRDKSAKEEKQLEALKHKQLKELRKRERGGSDAAPPALEMETVVIKSDEGSHSQSSEPSATPKEFKKKTSNNSNTKSSTKSHNSITIVKKEPEIKILCHITAKNKEEAEKLSKECIKEITQPIRETLMRQAKLRTTDKSEENTENEQEKEKKSENPTESVQIKKEEKTDCSEDVNARELEIHRRTLRSPRLLRGKTPIKLTRSRSQMQSDTVQNLAATTPSPNCKVESVDDTVSEIKSLDNKSFSPVNALANLEKQNTLEEELSLVKPDIHAIATTPSSIIQQKLQMALEESRKSKPSIFIVQSLECKKDVENNLKTKIQKEQIANKNNLKKSLKSVSKFNRNDLKRAYKNHKGKKYPTCKRQLRNRKIIVIKTSKPKQKSLETLKEIKRELRSSPRNIGNQQNILEEPNKKLNNKPSNQVTKSYRNVQTETKDLENYLVEHKTQTKTRLMAKASALLERSRRMTLRGSGPSANTSNLRTKLIPKIQKSKLSLHKTRTQILKPRVINNNRKLHTSSAKLLNTTALQQKTILPPINIQHHPNLTNLTDNENVVVSSTTNNYDERPLSHDPPLNVQSPITLASLHNSTSFVIASTPIQTKDQSTQFNSSSPGIKYLNSLPSATQTMRNPLKLEYGSVLYIYNEVDILIVIQERLISFWKCSKLINILSLLPATKTGCSHQTQHHHQQSEFIELQKQLIGDNCCNTHLKQPASSSSVLMDANVVGDWILLGELRRLNYDFEISVPYANRICLHNSTPIYLEMRAKQLPKNQRDCNLLSMYINIYYYHDEDMIAKCNSIALDSIQSDINSVNYTTLIDSRYFIMTWPQENHLGKTRSGLCKYSLTPQLDTLASIREFKSMRHTIRYLECMSDDKLIGFGDTQVTIWDHRSGDVLMNFDLEIALGKHLGSVYFSSHDIEQNNMLILHQYRHDLQNNITPQLITLACTVTHNQPSYRLLQEVQLPMPAFKTIQSAINTGDHLVVTAENNQELWISTTNPKLLTLNEITTTANSKRFYSRDRTQLIELTDKTLSVNTMANHIMQLAAVNGTGASVWH